MSIRVLHWFPNFSAGGGVANSVLGLASAQAKAGADVTVVSLPHDRPIYGEFDHHPQLRLMHWTGHAVGRGPMQIHVPGRAARSALRALKPDVVHVHAEFNPDNWWPPTLWSCPFVLSPHGAFHATVLDRGARRKVLYTTVAQRLLYDRIVRFHALNPAEEADIATAIPEAQTYCLPQGPSPAVSAFLAEQPDSEPRVLSEDPTRFLFVGRLDVEPKGLDVLVEAFAQATRESPTRPSVLTLVGPDTGGGAARLADLARRLGVENCVEVRPPVAQKDVPALIAECDVYVQLSRNEGSPLSLNDALAIGRPAIVSSRVGTVSDTVIRAPGHILVVEPESTQTARAIAEALRDLDGFRERAWQAQATMRSLLSWESAARQHLELYNALVAERQDG